MNLAFRPQPLLSEVLSGALTLALVMAIYFDQDHAAFSMFSDRPAIGFLSFGAFLLASWIAGTILDSIRNLAEWLWDIWAPLYWDFFFKADREKMSQFDENYYVYYCAKANYAIGMLLIISGTLSLYAGNVLVINIITCVVLVIAVIIFVVGFLDAWSLRAEIRKLIGHREAAHAGVYTRLKQSKRGVGVFAIRDIPEGTDIFATDTNEIREIDPRDFSLLGPELKKLYEDFCVNRNGKWLGPTNFNNLTPGWYLNHSDNPNVRCDKEYNFIAVRNIELGEELTTDYRTYDDRVVDFSRRGLSSTE